MSEQASSNDRFPWKRLATKIVAALGVPGSVGTLILIFEPDLSAVLARHWWTGWAFAAVLGLLCIVTFEVALWRRDRDQPATIRAAVDARVAEMAPQLKDEAVSKLRLDTIRDGAQSRSDSSVITQLWGPFETNGRLYEQLDLLPSNKYFSTELSDEFYRLEERLSREDWQVYDAGTEQVLADARDRMRAYWEPIRPLLDGSEGNFNLRILEPPGGTWGRIRVGDDLAHSWERNPGASPWDEYYAFVNSIAPLKHDFLRAMDRLGAHRNALLVRSQIGASLKAASQ